MQLNMNEYEHLYTWINMINCFDLSMEMNKLGDLY